ncbi:hypothetical protein BO94DRAFT_545992 [Aspergillus sclerotioniger CBS 115572]|uniref:F-box domain-containing protein n=1 Tax=Aspergillus sclerotioniger CBS 115572 TaxID=1450535 RepID=A0A317WP77_9EURO|nr:hypothetical protein BO94DRAFT_545992 [Aspergillus sclerotioniger CBS 115572]PWY87805.1 hypothetical protein BO94DRAFT_545992 [Aspergillus sclerotioniger CBS 115572]
MGNCISLRRRRSPPEAKKPRKTHAPLERLPPTVFYRIARYLDQADYNSLYCCSEEMAGLAKPCICASLPAGLQIGQNSSENEIMHMLATNPETNHLPMSLHVILPYIGDKDARNVSEGGLSYDPEALHSTPEMGTVRRDLNNLVNCKDLHFTLARADQSTGLKSNNKVLYIEDALYAVLADTPARVEKLTLDSRVVKSWECGKSAMHESLDKAWSNLKSLEVRETLSSDFSKGTAISHILQHAPELQSLSLNSLAADSKRSKIFRVASSASIKTNRLESLVLADLAVKPEDLTMWLTRFGSTLKTLELYSVLLADGSWKDVIQTIQDKCTNLQKVVVQYPQGAAQRGPFLDVTCSGSDLHSKLEQFKGSVAEAGI